VSISSNFWFLVVIAQFWLRVLLRVYTDRDRGKAGDGSEEFRSLLDLCST